MNASGSSRLFLSWFTAGAGLLLAGLALAPARAAPGAGYLPICAIQGKYYTSLYEGEQVATRGVVVADFDDLPARGFYLQAEACDGDPETSDGIFVHLPARQDLVRSGDLVEVSGPVQEYEGRTEIDAAPPQVAVLSSGSPLPPAEALSPPPGRDAAELYLERREAMLAGLEAIVVGPTDSDDRTWLLPASLGIGRVFPGEDGPGGQILCADDGGRYEITPEARTGDQLGGLVGVVDGEAGFYCLELVAAPRLTPAPVSPEPPLEENPGAAFSFYTASVNLANLFDTYDDPATGDTVLSSAEYQRRLQKRALLIHSELGEPLILAVQEAENLQALKDLVHRPEIIADYSALLVEGIDPRGLDSGLLYRPDHALLLEYRAPQGCTALVDGLGPDGNGDVYQPANALTCDLDGDGLLDGNRLFSRPPLIAHFILCQDGCLGPIPTPGVDIELWVLALHLKSKVEDSRRVAYTLPRRTEQARFIAGCLDEIRRGSPGARILVTGDLNDELNSEPLSILASAGLVATTRWVAPDSRYTYIFRGLSQALDHALFTPTPRLAAHDTRFVHANADYPASYQEIAATVHGSSDHDPVLVRWIVLERSIFFPVLAR